MFNRMMMTYEINPAKKTHVYQLVMCDVFLLHTAVGVTVPENQSIRVFDRVELELYFLMENSRRTDVVWNKVYEAVILVTSYIHYQRLILYSF
jgi:hypothetical protein